MPQPHRTQKQIADRYKGNLGYYKMPSRWRRARFWTTFLGITGGLIAILLYDRRGKETFFTTGPIVSAHASFGDDCAKCHDAARMAGGPLTAHQFAVTLKKRFREGIAFQEIDQKCETCHKQHTFHEPNVVENRSCSTCHQEHQGPGPMQKVASQNCAACHNARDVMEASAQKGSRLPAEGFHLRPQPARLMIFNLPRPPQGYTQVFATFAGGHPEFQHDYQKARDPDVLRFNHQRHMASDIPPINGAKLDCNFCHQPEPDGNFMKRPSFAANCQACHSLQFDARNPELTLPHGDPAAVRGFLRGLPSQYEALALRKGLTKAEQVRFVQTAMTQLRDRVRSGEDFERQIFFTADPYTSQMGQIPAVRPTFHGCAFCHEVKPSQSGTPAVTKPVFMDRWMPHAHFNHAKHTSVACEKCHNAPGSRETSDVLMPSKASCVVCHSPAGKVASECTTCHEYHNIPDAMRRTVAGATSVKEMLLGPAD
jgi:hypothetical protein